MNVTETTITEDESVTDQLIDVMGLFLQMSESADLSGLSRSSLEEFAGQLDEIAWLSRDLTSVATDGAATIRSWLQDDG